MLLPILLIIVPGLLLSFTTTWANLGSNSPKRKAACCYIQMVSVLAMGMGFSWFAIDAQSYPPRTVVREEAPVSPRLNASTFAQPDPGFEAPPMPPFSARPVEQMQVPAQSEVTPSVPDREETQPRAPMASEPSPDPALQKPVQLPSPEPTDPVRTDPPAQTQTTDSAEAAESAPVNTDSNSDSTPQPTSASGTGNNG